MRKKFGLLILSAMFICQAVQAAPGGRPSSSNAMTVRRVSYRKDKAYESAKKVADSRCNFNGWRQLALKYTRVTQPSSGWECKLRFECFN